MEGAEGFDGQLARPFDRTLITDVDDYRHHGVADPLGLRRERRLVDVGHHDAHAFSHEGFDQRQPDSAGRPGHDANTITKVLHVVDCVTTRHDP